MSWALLRQFPPLVWTVILGTFMVRTSYYMVWPFLSILLYREYGLSATTIGALLGGWILAQWNGQLLYALMALLCLLTFLLYEWGARIPRPELARANPGQ
ncbi:hypothetical protein Ri1_09420 [Aeromonas dhakensis]|nr:hypothetical protein AI20_02880 [Aeromonas hydrophila YL17]BEJ48343.1 hypothetical protein Ri1_09420 [Aeromonas dhakensis]